MDDDDEEELQPWRVTRSLGGARALFGTINPYCFDQFELESFQAKAEKTSIRDFDDSEIGFPLPPVEIPSEKPGKETRGQEHRETSDPKGAIPAQEPTEKGRPMEENKKLEGRPVNGEKDDEKQPHKKTKKHVIEKGDHPDWENEKARNGAESKRKHKSTKKKKHKDKEDRNIDHDLGDDKLKSDREKKKKKKKKKRKDKEEQNSTIRPGGTHKEVASDLDGEEKSKEPEPDDENSETQPETPESRRQRRLQELLKAANEADAEEAANPDDPPASEGSDQEEEEEDPGGIGILVDPQRPMYMDTIPKGTKVRAADRMWDGKFRAAKIASVDEPPWYTVSFGRRKQPNTHRVDIQWAKVKTPSRRILWDFRGNACAAARDGDLIKLSRMIQRNPNLIDRTGGPKNKTPLYYAAKAGHKDVVKFLLRCGATDDDGEILGVAAPEIRSLLLHFGWGKTGPVSRPRSASDPGSGREHSSSVAAKKSLRGSEPEARRFDHNDEDDGDDDDKDFLQ